MYFKLINYSIALKIINVQNRKLGKNLEMGDILSEHMFCVKLLSYVQYSLVLKYLNVRPLSILVFFLSLGKDFHNCTT